MRPPRDPVANADANAVAVDPAATRSSLVRRLGDWGDDGGWQEFFDTYWKLIYSVAVRAGLSDAEARDVVQDTVVAVARRMKAGGYDRAKGSFKNWLCLIARRRIIDHFRRRTDPALRAPSGSDDDPDRTDLLARVPDPAGGDLDRVWEEEWRRNLLDAALDRVRRDVSPKQFQIYDLSVLRGMPLGEVGRLLKVNAAQVYLARHRVGRLLRAEVARLESRAEESPVPT
ncbi:MAG: sigma-70 family RNA polymerase sigma factor [Verrucomicrobiae bacterium]|nr:sigma-70 family RNA polymerase sigma factor [Verrucomicrobiae bacterium]